MGWWRRRATLSLLGASALLSACGLATTPQRPPATDGPAAQRSATVTPGRAPVGPTEPARVVRVVDGDTIVVDRGRGNERLRYIGIDAPESVKPDSAIEFMGREASAANAALVDGREVVLERDVSDRDRFDRLLRYVWLQDGDTWTFVNLELVGQGYAQVTTHPPDVRWRDELAVAQRGARDAGSGLWAPATPAP